MCFIIEVDFVLALKNLFAILGSGSTFGRRTFKYTFKLKYWWWYSGKPLKFLLCVFLFLLNFPSAKNLLFIIFFDTAWENYIYIKYSSIHQILIYAGMHFNFYHKQWYTVFKNLLEVISSYNKVEDARWMYKNQTLSCIPTMNKWNLKLKMYYHLH